MREPQANPQQGDQVQTWTPPGIGPVPADQVPAAALLEVYEAEMARRIALGRATRAHAADSRRKLRGTLDRLGAATVAQVTLERAEADQVKRARARSNRTANEDYRPLRHALRLMVQAGVLASDPLARLAKLPAGGAYRKQESRSLTVPEARDLLAAAHELDSRLGHRRPRIPQAGLVYTALSTGARFSELRRLRWLSFAPDHALLLVEAERSKVRRPRRIPISPRDREILQRLRDLQERFYRERTRPEDLMFVSPTGARLDPGQATRWLHQCADWAGIAGRDGLGRGVGWNSLRKYVANRMLQAGIDSRRVSAILGNSPRVVAEWYEDFTGAELSEARRALPELLEGPSSAVRESVVTTSMDLGAANRAVDGGTPKWTRTTNLLIRSQGEAEVAAGDLPTWEHLTGSGGQEARSVRAEEDAGLLSGASGALGDLARLAGDEQRLIAALRLAAAILRETGGHG